MKFAIITHAAHGRDGEAYFAYGPYVREMDIWMKFASQVLIVAPLTLGKKTNIDAAYQRSDLKFKRINAFNLKTPLAILKSVFLIPHIVIAVYRAMDESDHIHLRCPGNVGLIGCVVQIFFPKKPKTAKYAGNWDPDSKQPLSYRLQKWILSNTYLTRNMQVLVYGDWPGNNKNIRSFFTATYHESEKIIAEPRLLSGKIEVVFAGTLTSGKRPIYAMELVKNLVRNNHDVYLSIYGDGMQIENIKDYILANNLETRIFLKGSQPRDVMKTVYQQCHFVILPSRSEGWPKVIAEGMFWGSVPIATRVSCVPYMLDYGKRGILLDIDREKDTKSILSLLNDAATYDDIARKGINWSRQYTLDEFDKSVKSLLRL